MKKLTLNLDELTVHTFETAAVRDGAGTVVGNAKTDRAPCGPTIPADCSEPTVNEWTCWATCGVCTE